ncbi:serine hydrolase [Flavobacterium sp.]|uniref:serine hydrolase n=1 Tax=Flavobacterium sp. TaxID=239 RepID=UPI00262A9137|nr:serine hydrolase [Flavobacterium sp.]
MTFSSTKRYSIWHVGLIALLAVCLALATAHFFTGDKSKDTVNSNNTASVACNFNVKRLAGYRYVRPLMFVDGECESENLMATKSKINGIIEAYKRDKGVTGASMYLRSGTDWINVNEGEQFEPGSLFKVPVMIAILKMDEDNPGFLNKRVAYSKVYDVNKKVAYAAKSIVLGQTYTIRQLLEYMIRYSDNNATALLETYMKPEILQKLFADLGLEVPNIYAAHYFFTSSQYSLFIRSIYNAGYLNIDNSEFAAELLSECEFKDGIMKGLPAGTKVVHKFGEAGNPDELQLHESGIVYLDGKSYLLTVMTKGKDNKVLSDLIGDISKAVYDDMQAAQ